MPQSLECLCMVDSLIDAQWAQFLTYLEDDDNSSLVDKLFGLHTESVQINNTDSEDLHTISSDPVRICFCKDEHPDCSYQWPLVSVKKGYPWEKESGESAVVLCSLIWTHYVLTNSHVLWSSVYIPNHTTLTTRYQQCNCGFVAVCWSCSVGLLCAPMSIPVVQVQLHSTAFTRLFLPLWAGETTSTSAVLGEAQGLYVVTALVH